MKATTSAILFFLACGASAAWLQESSRPLRAAAADAPSDAVDDVVRAEMQKRRIPGLSLAIIQDGKIVKATGYGVTEKGGDAPVTTSTLFQAGSISKSVAGLGALRLVEQGKLTLDEDVNTRLVTWKVPENEFTREKKVTLRGLLSHTAGLTVHGFPGYDSDGPVPTLVQVLDGAKPANTRPIRVDVLPGSKWRYSGGGYTVMQQMIIDVTGKPFPPFMQEAVLGPLGMEESTFEQPLPAEKAKLTATAHLQDRSLVKGKWHIYPEMAAAGLWTTPSDLSRFAIGVQEALAGRSDKTLSKKMTRQMLTEEKDNDGLGVFLEGSGSTLRFGHGGRDEGFDARLIAYAETGQGAAIMINTNDNSQMVSRILEAIAREYHWPEYPSSDPLETSGRRGRPGQARRLLGALRVREQSDADARGRARSSVDPRGRFPRRGVPAGSRRPLPFGPAGCPDHLPQGRRRAGRRIPLEGGRAGEEGAAHRSPVPYPETPDRSRPGEDGQGRRRAEGPRGGREGDRRFDPCSRPEHARISATAPRRARQV